MSSRYVNDMIIRYYTLCRIIREITEDTENFADAARDSAVEHLTREREAIKNLLDQDLADSVRLIRDDFTVRR